jgi:hypothetical protein
MMLSIFLMLTFTTSLTLHNTAIMTIHNQHPDIELVAPVYFCNCGTYYEYPVEGVDTNTITRIGFRFELDQNESSGILVYGLRRKNREGSDHQSSVDTIYTKVIEEASKMTRLLVTWKVKHSWGPRVKIMLVEYDNGLVLSEDKLAQLYEKVNDIYSVYHPDKDTWLMCDNTILKATHSLENSGLRSKITISEGLMDRDVTRSRWIDSER